jgi:glycine betaine/proline transport system substrate-binding protein
MDYFKARTIPGPVLNAELVWADDNNGTGADAAAHFLSTRGDIWESWVSDDVASAVKAAL